MNQVWAKVLNDAKGGKLSKTHELEDMFARAWALQQNGHVADAVALYRQILRKRPNHFESLHLLGLCEYQNKNLDEAARLIKRATLADPRSVDAHCNLAGVLVAAHRPDEALTSAGRALALKPDSVEAHYNSGNALLGLGRSSEALASFEKVVALNPKHAPALAGRGTALWLMGRYEDAVTSQTEALALRPDYLEAVNNRGCAYRELQRLAEAFADFDRAVTINPDFAEGWLNRAQILRALENFDGAFASYNRALTLNPQIVEAWLGMAAVFAICGKTAEALAATQKALTIRPDSSMGFTRLGQCLASLGETDSALACFDKALAIKPDDEPALQNKIFSLDFSEKTDYALHQQVRSEWWERFGSKDHAHFAAPHDNDRDPNRRIIVGYVSSDFLRRSPAYAFRPVLRNHDKAQFEVICYSGALREDDVTQSFMDVADRWRAVAQWSDAQLTEAIRADKVDILVDLSGHTGGNRLHVFARKPAPVQVHAWGFGTGTGLPVMDYMFSDAVVLPAEVRHLFAEQIYDLPSATMMEPPPAELRGSEPPVLAKGYITYGYFNRMSKASDKAMAVWARILQSNPTARLLMKDTMLTDPAVRKMYHEKFEALGIAPDRIDLLGSTPREEHLMAYQQVDVCLDPFPQGGGISTWEALYMGVPVVTTLGVGVSSRLAAAIQAAVGAPEWTASNDDEYVEIASRAPIDRLKTLRRDLPAMIDLECGPVSYTRAVERAYRTMWQAYCSAPNTLRVTNSAA